MVPIVSIWPQQCLGPLAAATQKHIDKAGVSGLHRFVGPAACDKIASEADNLHRELINLNDSDTTLHIVCPVLLSDAKAADLTRDIARQLKDAKCAVTFHVIGFFDGISRLIDCGDTHESDSSSIYATKSLAEIHEVAKENSDIRMTFSVIDDYAESGAPVGFSPLSLAFFLTEFIKLLMENFSDIFAPSAISEHTKCVSAIGMGGSTFRLDEIVEYLMHKAFKSVLENARLNERKIDIPKCQMQANRCLSGCPSFFNDFWDSDVQPLLNEGENPQQVRAKINDSMRQAGAEFYTKATSAIEDQTLNWTEKEAVFALITGRDNEKFTGRQYYGEALAIEDTLTDPVKLYIDTDNSRPLGQRELPARGDYELLSDSDVSSETTVGATTDTDNDKAFDATPLLKEVKRRMLDITSSIRENEDQLQRLRRNSESEKLAKVIARRPVNAIPEKALELTYEPAPGLKPAESVDMRAFLAPPRDQGQIGACSTFAVIALYEIAMNHGATNPNKIRSLSEGFLFHHTNIITGRPEGGSNYFEQIEAMGKYGSCDAELFGYDQGQTPDENTIEEAKNHRILQAKQIKLQSSADKFKDIRENHRLITSALTEGHAVGIALRIFDDFGQHGAHIGRPSDEDIATPTDSAHAMVVVGYSETDKCYIVRNSWGTDFGDKGYCYISASYIDDPDLNTFACIVTGITDQPGDYTPNSATTVKFGGTQNEIKAASLSNSIDEMRVELASLQAIYSELYRYYRNLMDKLAQPAVRNNIWLFAQENENNRVAACTVKLEDLQKSLPEKIKNHKKDYFKYGFTLSLISLILICLTAGFFAFNDNATVSAITLAAAVVFSLITAIYWINYKIVIKRRRRNLTEEAERCAIRKEQLQNESERKQLKFHVAGMVIDEISRQISNIEARYSDIVSFNTNMRAWLAEDSEKEQNALAEIKGTLLSVGEKQLFDDFFLANKDDLTDTIDLPKIFSDYHVSMQNISTLRSKLESEVKARITPLFESFNMPDYLAGWSQFDYLPPVNLQQMMIQIDRLANPLLRHSYNGNSNEMRFLSANVDDQNMQRWISSCRNHFSFTPCFLSNSDRTSLHVLTLKFIPPEFI